MPKSMNRDQDEPRYQYLRFELTTEDLLDECRARLEQLGVECVQEGGAHEAFGIVDESLSMEALDRLPAISSVAFNAPPTGF